MSILLQPITVGDLELPNRIIMAPLTRTRAGAKFGVERVPNPLMAAYYAQRASAGLIIAEATAVTPMGVGYANSPGIWSAEQVEGWKLITNTVHACGGQIVIQLWHVGRISDPIFLGGELPVAPSAIAASGYVNLVRPQRPYVTPRALELSEIAAIVKCYRIAAQNAELAGFDGVEIHAANGYLLDQFLQDSVNLRNDEYGGSIANRARIILEVVDSIIPIWGSGRVGVHIAPRCDKHSMGDSNPLATFSHLVKELNERKIAFLCARESLGQNRNGHELRAKFAGVYIANEGFTKKTAEETIEKGEADAVAFGIPYIANPDLVRRFQLNAPLNAPDIDKFFFGEVRGYLDYPVLCKRKMH